MNKAGNPLYGTKYKGIKQDGVFNEPCNAKLSLRVPDWVMEDLKQRDNWQDFVRSLLKESLEKNPHSQGADN